MPRRVTLRVVVPAAHGAPAEVAQSLAMSQDAAASRVHVPPWTPRRMSRRPQRWRRVRRFSLRRRCRRCSRYRRLRRRRQRHARALSILSRQLQVVPNFLGLPLLVRCARLAVVANRRTHSAETCVVLPIVLAQGVLQRQMRPDAQHASGRAASGNSCATRFVDSMRLTWNSCRLLSVSTLGLWPRRSRGKGWRRLAGGPGGASVINPPRVSECEWSLQQARRADSVLAPI